jgi:hypothetical protein
LAAVSCKREAYSLQRWDKSSWQRSERILESSEIIRDSQNKLARVVIVKVLLLYHTVRIFLLSPAPTATGTSTRLNPALTYLGVTAHHTVIDVAKIAGGIISGMKLRHF